MRDLVDFYSDSGVGVITLTHGEEGNRLTPELLAELESVFMSAFADENVRVVLLRSNGPAFCLGMDLSRLVDEEDQRALERAVSAYGRLLLSIYLAAKPVVAVVGGEVVAGGVGLVAACDIVVAAEEAVFELSEVLFGLIPANVLPYLFCLRLSPQKTRYLILASKRIGAREAANIGLADECFAAEDMEKGVKALFKRLMRSSPSALARAKLFTQEIYGRDHAEVRAHAESTLLELAGSDGVRSALQAFQDGDTPEWFTAFRPARPLARPDAASSGRGLDSGGVMPAGDHPAAEGDGS